MNGASKNLQKLERSRTRPCMKMKAFIQLRKGKNFNGLTWKVVQHILADIWEAFVGSVPHVFPNTWLLTDIHTPSDSSIHSFIYSLWQTSFSSHVRVSKHTDTYNARMHSITHRLILTLVTNIQPINSSYSTASKDRLSCYYYLCMSICSLKRFLPPLYLLISIDSRKFSLR